MAKNGVRGRVGVDMKRLIAVIVILFLAGTAWAGAKTVITCDQCDKQKEPDQICSRYSYYVVKRVDVETGNFSCLDYNTPYYKVFCSTDCLRASLQPAPKLTLEDDRWLDENTDILLY